MNRVQIVTNLADQITRLFDDVSVSQEERLAALNVARALVPVSNAPICSGGSLSSEVPAGSAASSGSGSEAR